MDAIALKEKSAKWIGKYKYFLLVLLIGVGLMLIPERSKTNAEPVHTTNPSVQKRLSDELEEILSRIEGAGQVKVMLTMKTGEQTIYQSDGNHGDKEDTVIITDENRAQSGLVQQVIPPSYRGAIVLCHGADRAVVCLAITEAVAKVTGLDSSQISVLKLN